MISKILFTFSIIILTFIFQIAIVDLQISQKNIYNSQVTSYSGESGSGLRNKTLQDPNQFYIPAEADPVDIDCLARNMYFEARGEPQNGLLAVAYVTMNRVSSEFFPNAICDVVYEPRQFSWTFDNYSNTPPQNQTWEEIYKLAEQFIISYPSLKNYDFTEGSIYFHADYVNPRWSSSVNRVIQIGSHIFYNSDVRVPKT